MFRKLVLLFVSSVSCFSAAVYAVGLGDYELKSGLNQPLRAQITLLSSGELNEYEVHASLASAAVFERVGIDKPFYLNNIKFETVKKNGRLVINLSTREPIKEPFMNFLVELNSPKERVVREYTFLLDPPIFDKSASSTIQKAQSKKKTNKTVTRRNVRSSSSTYDSQPSFSGDSYGPVSSTDTLWSIANKVRPNSDVSIQQTLVAIYRANPDAFNNGNINNLKRGAVLDIPASSSMSQVPHRAALQDVVMQNRQWQSGGARRIVGNTQTRASTRQGSGDARLTLATPDSDTNAGGASSGLSNRLQQAQSELVKAQETSATLQAENDELRSRLTDLVKKLESAQESGAVNISDTELAILAQNQKDSANDAIDNAVDDMTSTGDEIVDATEDTINDVDDTVSDIVDNTENVVDDASSTIDDVNGSDVVSTDSIDTDSTSSAATVPNNENTLYIPPPKKKGFFENLLESSAVIWGGLVAILLIVVAVFWKMRKRMEDDDFQDDLVATTGVNLTDSSDSFELPDVGDDMLVDMEEEAEASEDASEEEFDPLGEADIYIAYGKYEQAESLLLEAIDENPIRSDLKVKLMECYAESDDREKFDSLAQEVSQAVDAEEWAEQVASMKEKAWSGKDESDDFDLPSTEDIFGEDEFSIDDNVGTTAEKVLDSDDSDLDDDFDLDSDENSDEEFDIDMDLALDDDNSAESSSSAVTQTFDALDDSDFELDDDDSDELGSDLDEESIDLDDSDDLSLDLDEDEFDLDDGDSELDADSSSVENVDEISTKIDLARAYIDMGDSEGAKEILSEVIAEGTPEQQEEAKALIDKV